MQNQNLEIKTDLKRRAYTYALAVIKLIEKLPNDIIGQVLGKQLLRSATSIGANIIEAKASSSKKDFTNFYTYALKSANESVFWLELLRDAEKINDAKIKGAIQETQEIAKILASSILTLKGKRQL